MRYTLNGKRDINVGKRTEQAYRYERADGKHIEFHAHPTRAWNYVVLSSDLTSREQSSVINGFIEAGISGNDDFENAIKQIEV